MVEVKLIKRRKATRCLLERAQSFLPTNVSENSGDDRAHDLGTLAAFKDFLDHDEFELALDQLQALGELNDCQGGFWRSLERAAQVMGLHSRAATLHRRFEEALESCNYREDAS